MNGTHQNSSNRLKAAEDRLAQALERLETALSQRSTDAVEDTQVSAELNAQVQSLRTENSELRLLVDSTAERLDGTIAKFKSQLVG